MTLKEIQQQNGFNTDKDSVHSYLEYYDTIFSVYKDKDINLLEIGIDKGGSLQLWNKYFTPNSTIYGMDVYLHPNIPEIEQLSNVVVLHKNAYNLTDNVLNPIKFDIIIEDGTHYIDDQITAYLKYVPRLTKGGIFIIEDLQPAGFEYFTNIAKHTPNCEIVNRVDVKGRYDDILFVYRNV